MLQAQQWRPPSMPRAQELKPQPMTALPTEALSLACQAHGHNPEWIEEKVTYGYAFSVKAHGKIFRSPGIFSVEREAKVATAAVALACLDKQNAPAQTTRASASESVPPGNAKGPTPKSSMRPSVKNDGTGTQQELFSIMKRLQAIYGTEGRDRAQDPITAAFLEGLSIGSRAAVANINNLRTEKAASDGGKDPQLARRRGQRPAHSGRTRSRSPSRDLHRVYRDEKPKSRSSQASIKQEQSASPSLASRGAGTSHNSHPSRRETEFPNDRRWDHDGYAQRYSSRM
ncbi:hypothetical protein B0T16DRAFT_453163 [Cercophora newfieldiana]|uniref:Uncharacterized protein n=1 Tax=Cercophora newfieldiana TaxID=92897 RepID=A0AA39YSB4_9PEZI|nr:hypothetical protein B0T16DRAFT_453163 [Cercophora newfieldiana]